MAHSCVQSKLSNLVDLQNLLTMVKRLKMKCALSPCKDCLLQGEIVIAFMTEVDAHISQLIHMILKSESGATLLEAYVKSVKQRQEKEFCSVDPVMIELLQKAMSEVQVDCTGQQNQKDT